MRTNHRGLHTFCTAAEHLSFKKAADELCVSPSAVSHQISELEEQLGAKLFKRKTRSIALTPEGSSLFEEIHPYLKAIDEATRRIRTDKKQVPLLVQMPEFFASELLMPAITEFTDRNQGIDLHIEGAGISREQNPDADVTVWLTRKIPQARRVERLFPIRYIPACSPRQRARWDESGISGLEAITNTTILLHKARPRAWHQWAVNAGLPELEPRKIILLDSMFALARAAEQGVGIALIPLPVSQDWFDSGALVRLHEFHLVTEDYYWVALNGSSSQRRAALSFFHWMLQKFQLHS